MKHKKLIAKYWYGGGCEESKKQVQRKAYNWARRIKKVSNARYISVKKGTVSNKDYDVRFYA